MLGEKPATPIDASGRDQARGEVREQSEQREAAAEQADSNADKIVGDRPSESVPTGSAAESSAVASSSQGTLVAPMSVRQEKVAAAGGAMLGAVFNFLGELVNEAPDASAPAPEVVQNLRERLSECTTTNDSGSQQLTVTLPNREALDNLADTLARMLVTKG